MNTYNVPKKIGICIEEMADLDSCLHIHGAFHEAPVFVTLVRQISAVEVQGEEHSLAERHGDVLIAYLPEKIDGLIWFREVGAGLEEEIVFTGVDCGRLLTRACVQGFVHYDLVALRV